MLVRSRAQKRGPRQPMQLTPPKKKIKTIGVSKSQVKLNSQRKQLSNTRASEMKIFKQSTVNT